MVTALTNAFNLIMSYFAWEDSEQARSSTNLEHAFELYSEQHKFLQGDIWPT